MKEIKYVKTIQKHIQFKSQIQNVIRYYNYNGTQLLYYEIVSSGGNGTWDGQPAREASIQYGYTFIGWNVEKNQSTVTPGCLENVTGNISVYAAYSRSTMKYTITWKDGNGSTLKTEQLYYGSTPSYSGTTPTKTSTARYTYTFNNTWSPSITTVTGDKTYTAQFTATTRKYAITWKDGDGNTLKTDQVDYGALPSYSGATPTKTSTTQYSYTFNNTWSPSITTVTGDKTYTAQFTATVRQYTITWKDGNNSTLKTDTLNYGATPSYSGTTPTKTSTAQYSYTFNNTWSPSITTVTGNKTYTAQFTSTVRQYTITWKDGNNSTLKTENWDYGSTPSYTGTTPTKTSTAQYSYTFNNTWSPTIASVTGNATYTAQFTSTVRKYTITWKNGDGATIKTDSVDYGTTPSYVGSTPTKTSTAQYNYTFNNTWSPTIVAVTGNKTYTAQFDSTLREYTITWKNGNTTLKSETLAYGTTPSYPGTPNKTPTAQYTYTFSGWNPTVSPVTGEATYYAQFTETVRSYDITWRDDNQTLRTDSVAYGDTPSYGGTPTRDTSSRCSFVFREWYPTVTSVTGNATYTAEYTPTFFSNITDTWAQIFAAEDNGTYKTKYSLGDKKTLTVNGVTLCMEIAAFDTDVLTSDTTQTAKITWVATGLIFGETMMSSTEYFRSTYFNWSTSRLRAWLNDTVLPTISSTVSNRILAVNKTYYDYQTSSTLTASDKLWIPSTREIWGGGGYESSGVTYPTGTGITYPRYIESDVWNLIRYCADSSSSAMYGNSFAWFLRTAYDNKNNFVVVNRTYSSNVPPYSYVGGYTTNGILICFCT